MRARALNDDEIRVLRVLCESRKPRTIEWIARKCNIAIPVVEKCILRMDPGLTGNPSFVFSDEATGTRFNATFEGAFLIKTLDAQAAKNPAGQEIFDEVRKELIVKPVDNAPLEFGGQARP